MNASARPQGPPRDWEQRVAAVLNAAGGGSVDEGLGILASAAANLIGASAPNPEMAVRKMEAWADWITRNLDSTKRVAEGHQAAKEAKRDAGWPSGWRNPP
jgi:hypothetical protein